MHRTMRIAMCRCCVALLALFFAMPASATGDEAARLVAAAHSQIGVTLLYDPSYQRLAFPLGDVPLDRGVCSDVIIRALRVLDVDLQAELNRDMRANFSAYPSIWGLRKPDSNIDHRRVPNLEVWFRRRGLALEPTRKAAAFLPGDIVSWRLEGGQPHIGLVSKRRSADGRRPLIVHNIGAGTQLEDVLFEWQPVGHFRYFSAPVVTRP